MKNKEIALAVLLVVYAILLVIAYAPNIIDEDAQLMWQTIFFNIAPIFSVLMGIYALRKYGIRSVHGKSILLLTIGLFFWVLGELTWSVFDLVLDIDPYPSFADVFYLVAYPFILIGIVYELKLGKISWTSKKIVVSIVILAVLSVITGYYGIYYAYDEEATITENVVAMSYGVGDLILMIGLIMLVNLSLEFSGGVLSKAWIVFAIGILVTWIVDTLFAIYYEPYEEGEWLYLQMDHLWIASYLLMGYSFLMMAGAIDKLKDFVDTEMKKK